MTPSMIFKEHGHCTKGPFCEKLSFAPMLGPRPVTRSDVQLPSMGACHACRRSERLSLEESGRVWKSETAILSCRVVP